MADELEIPTVLWGMYGVVLHANEAFRELTGFEKSVPNELGDFLLMEMFNLEALVFWRNNIHKYYDKAMTIPIEVKFRCNFVISYLLEKIISIQLRN